MRQFHGRGGELYLVSVPTPFQCGLADIGDGFDWRAADPAMRYWIAEEPLSFEVFESGGWRVLDPVEVDHASGRVGFPRCLAGLPVRASGTCLPLSKAGAAEAWDLHVEVTVPDSSVLGASHHSNAAVVGRSVAQLSGCWLEVLYRPFLAAAQVFALLPMALGAFMGLGSLSEKSPGLVLVSFDEKGVTHGFV